MASTIFDNHGRPITYVRLAVTDRCNLRCFYCMPAEGIQYVPRKELLSYEEMLRMLEILAGMGIQKVRLTGGEPFVRKGLMDFLERLSRIEGIEQINITTNGVLTTPFVPALKELGIHSVNLSLDTLDRDRFHEMTRRDELPRVLKCLDSLLEHGISTKINAVIMEGKNTDDIHSLAEFTRDHPINVRYIEEMPFNGTGTHYPVLSWDHQRILAELRRHYPAIQKIEDEAHSTSHNYQIPGYKGSVGIIAAFSRTFCGSCNRIRVTPQGMLKTCLYDGGVLNIRDLMRANLKDDAPVREAFLSSFRSRAKNGYEAEKSRKALNPVSESMSTIGG
ncbi:MAG: GTP 3',8-cyclase MoaA [Bacteroidota bacterium]